jgi:putative transposase
MLFVLWIDLDGLRGNPLEVSNARAWLEAPVGAAGDPPPLKWSDLRYVFDIQEDCNARKRYKPEEIVAKLRQVDVLVSQGENMADAIRQIGVSEVRYYRWRQEFGGLKTEQVKRLKDLELENSRLRKAVSVQNELVQCQIRDQPGETSKPRAPPCLH